MLESRLVRFVKWPLAAMTSCLGRSTRIVGKSLKARGAEVHGTMYPGEIFDRWEVDGHGEVGLRESAQWIAGHLDMSLFDQYTV